MNYLKSGTEFKIELVASNGCFGPAFYLWTIKYKKYWKQYAYFTPYIRAQWVAYGFHHRHCFLGPNWKLKSSGVFCVAYQDSIEALGVVQHTTEIVHATHTSAGWWCSFLRKESKGCGFLMDQHTTHTFFMKWYDDFENFNLKAPSDCFFKLNNWNANYSIQQWLVN